MAIFGNIFGGQKREAQAGAQSESARGGSYANNIVYANSPHAALSVAAFHRGVELRAKTMAQLVLEYQVMSKKGGNFERAFGSDRARWLNYLVEVKPNPMMTWVTLMEQAEIAKILQGNAIIYIERDGVDVKALWLCTNASYNNVMNSYEVSYYAPGGIVNLVNVPAEDVLHIKNTFTMNRGLVGISTLDYASNALSLSATSDKQTLENASKGGKVKLLVQEEKSASFGIGRASKDQMQKVTDKLNDDIYEKDVVLMTNIANVTPISQNAQQQELLESRKFNVKEIARFLGVPPILLMDDSNSSYKSPEAATQEFLLRTITPAIKEWENELDAKILGFSEFGKSRFHLCAKSLMRLDPAGQANIDKTNLETGVKSVNELRAQYDLPALEKGDLHYISTNLAELGSAKLSDGNGHEAVPQGEGQEKGGTK